jgi:hypothetical protein
MRIRRLICRGLTPLVVLAACACLAHAQAIVPGSGHKMTIAGDDFEDPEWTYVPNNPKSSYDVDKQLRGPAGYSTNRRWRENTDRGHPDVVRRVETPEGGLDGSYGALLLASKITGIPGQPSGKGEQDDIYMNIETRIGRYIPVSYGPSVTVRVYLQPFEEWEKKQGSSFAFRATCRGTKPDSKKDTEPYWPGIFINHNPRHGKNGSPASLVIRAQNSGTDYQVLPIKEPGWWTLGMSFSPDGMIHYYAHAGVDDLTAEDRVASHRPYNFKTLYLIDCFFDVFGANNGQTWTTGWIIDDPAVYTTTVMPAMQARGRAQMRPTR